MKLFELDDNDFLTGYYDPAEDKLNMRNPSQTRKPVLTLKDLNRLKRMRALKQYEDKKREDLLGILYAPPEAEGSPGPF